MKKILILFALAALPYFTNAQSCQPCPPGCDKKSCCVDPKKCEAKSITCLRSDLQSVINKMAKSSLGFNKQVVEMTIAPGETEDESLQLISQAASSIRHELESTNGLRGSRLKSSSGTDLTVAALKKEVKVLVNHAERF